MLREGVPHRDVSPINWCYTVLNNSLICRGMRRFSIATADPQLQPLDEELVRDQLSVAEELVYVGHREPALVAAGAAAEGAIRLAAGHLAGRTASGGALLEAVLAVRSIDEHEYDLLYGVLTSRDRLAHGFAPDPEWIVGEDGLREALDVVIRLLEPTSLADVEPSHN
jgi:hypothetical protein